MSIDSFPDLFLDQLRDLLSSERQQVRALPRLIAAIDYGTLSAALKSHLDETRHSMTSSSCGRRNPRRCCCNLATW